MIMLDSSTAIVYTHSDLSNAVSQDNGVDYIYLGADIIMTAGIRVNAAKTELVIDGYYQPEYDGQRTLSDAGFDGGQIYISASQSLIITFQNMIIAGRNYYGMPYVHNYTNAQYVTVIYQSVTYSGPQMIYHQRGLTRFIDCDVTITGTTSTLVQEVGEVCKVEIGGETIMRKMNTDHAVFWFYGASSRESYLKILSGANVTITTANYFMYEYYPPQYIIEQNARFILNTYSGISNDSGHSVASFLVEENASFEYTQAVNRGYATIYIDGALTVNEGAKFYMEADFDNINRLIRFTGSSAGLYINNPKSFVLYNRGTSTSATALYFAAATPFTLTGGQLNYWESSRTFPIAGTFEDEPLHKWNRPSWAKFTLRGTASVSQTNVTYNDFTPEEPVPPLSDLKLHLATTFSIGEIPLTINSAILTRHISGVTGQYANVKAVYFPSYYEDPQTEIADQYGSFSITPSAATPFSDYVEVFSNTPFLIVSAVKAVREENELKIIDAPEYIDFALQPLSGFPYVILPREDPEAEVEIVDTRDPKTEWRLWAQITGPLSTDEGDILEDAVVFGLQDGSIETLGTEFLPIHVGEPFPDSDEFSVTWPETRGVLARITNPIRSGRKYSTRLGWVILPIDEEPGDFD